MRQERVGRSTAAAFVLALVAVTACEAGGQGGVEQGGVESGRLTTTSSPSPHPRIVFNATRLAELRALVTSPTHSEIAAAMRASLVARHGASVLPSEFGDRRLAANALEGVAVAAILLNEPAYLELARQSLLNFDNLTDPSFDDLTQGHLLNAAAVSYDVLYDHLTEAERELVRSRIAPAAANMAQEVAAGVWWSHDFVQNHGFIDFAGLGKAGLALEGEVDGADTWHLLAHEHYRKEKVVLDLIPDGSWHEGIGYHAYAFTLALPFLLGARAHDDVMDDTQNLRGYGAYRLYTMLPDLTKGYITTHGDWAGWSNPSSLTLLRYAAARFRDPLAQEAGRRWLAGTGRSTLTYNLLHIAIEYVIYDPTVPVVDVSTLPLDFTATDQGLAVMRSGFGPGSAVLGLKSGVLGGRGNYDRIREGGYPGGILNVGHDHMDDLGLAFYSDGQWLLPECVGYSIGRVAGEVPAWQTQFHNSLLVDGVGQLGDERWGVHDAAYLPWFFEREGTLPFHRSTAHYSVARANGTRLYPAESGVTKLLRTTGFSRDGYAVLRDEVTTDRARKVEQLFHFLDTASVTSDGWIRGNAKNDRILGVRVVAPSEYSTEISTQTANKLTKEFEPDGLVSLVKVRSTTDTDSATFLELLLPGRGATWASRPAVTALDPAAPDHGLALPVTGGQEQWIFDGANAGTLALVGEVGVVRATTAGALSRVVLVGAGSLSESPGRGLLLSSPNDGILEVEYQGAAALVSGRGAVGARVYAVGITSLTLNGEAASSHRDGDHLVIDGPFPLPTVTALDPSVALAGSSVPVTITGTGFGPGATCSFGEGITATCTDVNATELHAELVVSATAPLGRRNASVTTPGGTGVLVDGFTVAPSSPPTVSRVIGATGLAGESLIVTIEGTDFAPEATCSFGAGIAVGCSVESSTQIRAEIVIAASAEPGARTVSVTTSAGTGELASAFTVLPAVGTVTLVSPSSGRAGTSLTVLVTGTGFGFGQECSFGEGIGAACVVLTPTQMQADLVIAPTAPLGGHTVSVTTPSGVAQLLNAFTVLPPTPRLLAVSPPSGAVGKTVAALLTGTGFRSEGLSCSFGTGILASCTFVSPTELAATLVIAPNASIGKRTVTVVTVGGRSAVKAAFTVARTVPVVTSVAPAEGFAGTRVTVTVSGSGFARSSLKCFIGELKASCSFLSPTRVRLVVSIPLAAAAGPRNVRVSTRGGIGELANAFEILPTPPSISRLAPASGAAGSTVFISVFGLRFVPDTTCSAGDGITVRCVFVNANRLTAQVIIDPWVAPGRRTFEVTTPAGTARTVDAFAVTSLEIFADNFTGLGDGLGEAWEVTGEWQRTRGRARCESDAGVATALFDPPENHSASVLVRANESEGAGLFVRRTGDAFYGARVHPDGWLEIVRADVGGETQLGRVDVDVDEDEDEYLPLQLRVSGTASVRLELFVGGRSVLEVTDDSASRLTAGRAGLLGGVGDDSRFQLFRIYAP